MEHITLTEAKHIAQTYIYKGPFTEKDMDLIAFLILDLSEHMNNKEEETCNH